MNASQKLGFINDWTLELSGQLDLIFVHYSPSLMAVGVKYFFYLSEEKNQLVIDLSSGCCMAEGRNISYRYYWMSTSWLLCVFNVVCNCICGTAHNFVSVFLWTLIAALWFHNVINLECGVAVNVFWRHMPPDYYDKTDVYGNKDLVAATRSEQILDRALKQLDSLPTDYRDFYARKMIARIQTRLTDQ